MIMISARENGLANDGFRWTVARFPLECIQRDRLRPQPTTAPSPLTASEPVANMSNPAKGKDAAIGERCAPSPGDSSTPPQTTASGPNTIELDALEQRDTQLARAACRTSGELPSSDVIAAVEAGHMATSQSANHDDSGVTIAAATGQAAAHVHRQGPATSSAGAANWAGFGQVIPVLAASPGCGASLVTTVLADAMQVAGQRVLMVDTADPARSGLAAAARSDGPVLNGPHPSVRIRVSWRAQALLARLETELPVVTPGMVPPPRFFNRSANTVQATVVDLSHDAWRVGAHPLAGAGAWLRTGSPMPRPVLVCRASTPSLLHAEQVLTRLEGWHNTGVITPPAQLVVVGATRWPAGVSGCAGRRVASLLDDVLFLPHDPEVEATGVTSAVTPLRLREALAPVLHRWELLPPPPPGAGLVTRLVRLMKGALA